MPLPQGSSLAGELSVTLAPLIADGSGDSIKVALGQVSVLRMRYVQMSATMPGLRPRDLDRAARRDLLASLRRRELTLSGLDAWIPTEHFLDAAQSDRAMNAVIETIALAADLGRVPVSVVMPASEEIVVAIAEAGLRAGVDIADHSFEAKPRESIGVGIDPAALLSHGKDPVAAVHAAARRLISARLVDLLRSGLRGPIGSMHEGRLDVEGYRVALSVNDYRRPVIIDARQWNDPLHGVEQAMRAWSEL